MVVLSLGQARGGRGEYKRWSGRLLENERRATLQVTHRDRTGGQPSLLVEEDNHQARIRAFCPRSQSEGSWSFLALVSGIQEPFPPRTAYRDLLYLQYVDRARSRRVAGVVVCHAQLEVAVGDGIRPCDDDRGCGAVRDLGHGPGARRGSDLGGARRGLDAAHVVFDLDRLEEMTRWLTGDPERGRHSSTSA